MTSGMQTEPALRPRGGQAGSARAVWPGSFWGSFRPQRACGRGPGAGRGERGDSGTEDFEHYMYRLAEYLVSTLTGWHKEGAPLPAQVCNRGIKEEGGRTPEQITAPAGEPVVSLVRHHLAVAAPPYPPPFSPARSPAQPHRKGASPQRRWGTCSWEWGSANGQGIIWPCAPPAPPRASDPPWQGIIWPLACHPPTPPIEPVAPPWQGTTSLALCHPSHAIEPVAPIALRCIATPLVQSVVENRLSPEGLHCRHWLDGGGWVARQTGAFHEGATGWMGEWLAPNPSIDSLVKGARGQFPFADHHFPAAVPSEVGCPPFCVVHRGGRGRGQGGHNNGVTRTTAPAGCVMLLRGYTPPPPSFIPVAHLQQHAPSLCHPADVLPQYSHLYMSETSVHCLTLLRARPQAHSRVPGRPGCPTPSPVGLPWDRRPDVITHGGRPQVLDSRVLHDAREEQVWLVVQADLRAKAAPTSPLSSMAGQGDILLKLLEPRSPFCRFMGPSEPVRCPPS